MNRPPRVLVAGLGNIFLGDDGFGVEVARRLLRTTLPAGIQVADVGIRGVHLAYDLAGSDFDEVILVDAVARGGAPGTLYVIEPEVSGEVAAADAHSLTPDTLLAWLQRVGGFRGRITIVGCEPASLDEAMELSAPVAAAVDAALSLVGELIAATRRTEASCV